MLEGAEKGDEITYPGILFPLAVSSRDIVRY